MLAAFLIIALEGTVPADAGTSADDGQQAYDAGRYEAARRIWAPLAADGDARAQLGLGFLDDLGKDTPRQPRSAFMWYLRAAEAGLAEAQFNVATMLDSGLDIERDAGRAAVWYAKAAAHGHRRAQFNLAQLYEAGDGVPHNLAQAAVWYRAAAQAGLSAAAGRLAGVEQALRRNAQSVSSRDEAALVPVQAEAPAAGATIDVRRDAPTVELVWAAPAQPVPTTFFVQVMARGPGGAWHEAFTRDLDQSAVLVPLDPGSVSYLWHVYVVAPSSQHYVVGDWSRFELDPQR